MATIDEKIAAIDEAIASGTTMVRSGETMVQYRSLAELNAIKAQLEAERDGRQRRTVAQYRRY